MTVTSSLNNASSKKRVVPIKPPPKDYKFRLSPLSAITASPPKFTWQIRDHMELNSIGMIFGAPASGKSFLAMDMAYCIAAGIDWNGNRTKQGKVVYVAGEGHAGLGKRFKALDHKYQSKANDIFVSNMPIRVLDQKDVEAVYQEIVSVCPKPSLMIIDTLHSNFGDGDENSSRDIAKFLQHLQTLKKALNCSILLVHHTGHSSADRGRGSSAIKAALDVEYKVKNVSGLVTVDCTKSKEFEPPSSMAFNIVSQPIQGWSDQDGNQISSAYLESAACVPQSRQPTISQQDQLVLDALKSAVSSKGVVPSAQAIGLFPALRGKKYVSLDDWRAEAYTQMDNANGTSKNPDTNRKAFSRAKNKLIGSNTIAEHDDHFWEIA